MSRSALGLCGFTRANCFLFVLFGFFTGTLTRSQSASAAPHIDSAAAFPGSAPGPAAQDRQECKDTVDFLCITKSKVESLEPSPGGRFWRAWQYQYQFSEQPAFTAVLLNGSTQIVANPEKYLNQHTFTFQFSELFPNTSNLASVLEALYAVEPDVNKATKTVRLDNQLCHGKSPIECLVSGGNVWERLLSAATVNFSLSERDEVQQGVLLTSFPSSQHYGPAGEVDFDPASLFVTGTNWQTAVASLKGIRLDTGQFFGDDEASCFVKPKDPTAKTLSTYKGCVKEFARPRLAASMEQGVWTRIGAVLIPKFQFKATSQFDYLKNGGVLISEPGLQKSLKSYTFTWDLKRVFPSTADRIAAAKAYKGYSLPQSESGAVAQPKLCVTISDKTRGYIPVESNFTVDQCRVLAQAAGADNFALACATTGSVVIGRPINGHGGVQDANLPDSNTCNWLASSTPVPVESRPSQGQ